VASAHWSSSLKRSEAGACCKIAIMTRHEVRARIQEIGIIPALRVHSAEDALFAAQAVASGGIPIVEVTMTVAGALDVIAKLVQKTPGVLVGAGTVLDLGWARKCLDAGAMFLTSPGLDLAIVDFGASQDVVVLPGALTPSEVIAAAKAGADFIKIFPCGQVGGPGYIRALKSPFPELRFIASGGVNQLTVADYSVAGATAVGIGADLIHRDAIQRREEGWIVELSRRYVNMVGQARELLRAG
jgi:2-dehydro-3-deoxyphosphogluconate aldolase/(4S)-4-hydroxy-2-oxoglutarate aldolase